MIAAARTRYEKRLPRSIRRRMPRFACAEFFLQRNLKELYVPVQFFHRLLRSVQKAHTKTVPGIVWNLYEAYRFQREFRQAYACRNIGYVQRSRPRVGTDKRLIFGE